ncbi:MAG: hypothetical protein H0Z34_12670 [Brevibacillus sp.]|nr:hypothetical protein [Brevibacillus sp.]
MTSQLLLYGIIALLLIASGFFSIRFVRRQQTEEFDKEVSRTTAKHPVLGNPIVIAYMIGFAILAGFWLLSFLY